MALSAALHQEETRALSAGLCAGIWEKACCVLMEELCLLLAVWYSGLDEQLPWPVPIRAEVARLWCGLVPRVGCGKAGGGVALQILLRALRQCLCTAPAVLPCCGPPLRLTEGPAGATSCPELCHAAQMVVYSPPTAASSEVCCPIPAFFFAPYPSVRRFL